MSEDVRILSREESRNLSDNGLALMLDRELRQARAKVVPNVKRETLQNAILENASPSARLYTDQFVSYTGLGKKFIHEVVDHSREYVRGSVHTNGLENFWSLLKRTLRGLCGSRTSPHGSVPLRAGIPL